MTNPQIGINRVYWRRSLPRNHSPKGGREHFRHPGFCRSALRRGGLHTNRFFSSAITSRASRYLPSRNNVDWSPVGIVLGIDDR